MKEMIKFDMPKNQSSIIKVIGVGGGGSNAVNHMFRQGIKGVDFIICNTDAQAMESSPVPTKIQLGEKGLGAGSIPAVGKESARQKIDQIKEILEKNTQMLFITAGMGGGTGTGAAPVIASIARELGILTVGIVTIPFTFEGKKRRLQAEEGIFELKQHVDTLLIICNDKLRESYGDLKLSEAFDKADDVLTTAARGIAEIITVTGYINVDFEDVKTVMSNSGKAIMGSAAAEGENRAIEAVKGALSSPLLNDNEIEGASDVLLYITSGLEEISMDEVTEITDYIQREAKSQAEIIWGNGYDESLGKKISITLIATGFDSEKSGVQDVKIRHELKEECKQHFEQANQPPQEDIAEITERIEILRKPILEEIPCEETAEVSPLAEPEAFTLLTNLQEEESAVIEEQVPDKEWKEDERTFVFEFSQVAEDEMPEHEEAFASQPEAREIKHNEEQSSENKSRKPEEIKPFELYIKKPGGEVLRGSETTSSRPSIDLKSQERIERLRNLSLKLRDESAIEELEHEPAYVRRNVELKDSALSSEARVSRYSLYEDNDSKGPEIRSGNSFLHDNVD